MPDKGEVYSSDSPGGIGTGTNSDSGGSTNISTGHQTQYDKGTGSSGQGERVSRDGSGSWHYTNQNEPKGSSDRH